MGGRAPARGLRPRRFEGIVEEGLRLGRRLGVPTANLAVAYCDPALWGSWAALVRTRAGGRRALAHVGVRPSVGGGRVLVEAHLLDFEGDLYGQPLAVDLLEKVSEELAFSSLAALEKKIHDDLRRVRELFARIDHERPPRLPAAKSARATTNR